jgi:hypothetical protein
MPWLPEWRVTINDDVYTNVTAVSFASGRLDIDRQPTAGYCRVQIINTDGSPFTINVSETITLELKNSSGTYVTVFGGEVSDFSIGVRSPEETGFITMGTVLGVGSLARLTKAVYNTALAEGLDGAQIAAILGSALSLPWSEVSPTLTWATYPATTTWANAETSVGEIDAGFYTMIALAASASARSNTLADQIANSALGQIFETKSGKVDYADADHRSTYLVANGYTNLDSSYAAPSTIRSTTQTSRIRNSLIYRYSTGYGSTYTASDSDSIATYGLYERSYESNIKNSTDIDDIAARELDLRATPRGSLETITFRLDNPDMPSVLLDRLINTFFGQPVLIQNLPSNMLGGSFGGFVENIVMNATPTFVDLTLYVSATAFSLSLLQWQTITPTTLTWAGVNGTLTWNNATGALT